MKTVAGSGRKQQQANGPVVGGKNKEALGNDQEHLFSLRQLKSFQLLLIKIAID
jgi:hypothetical protein